jgi:hypothetical protein
LRCGRLGALLETAGMQAEALFQLSHPYVDVYNVNASADDDALLLEDAGPRCPVCDIVPSSVPSSRGIRTRTTMR